LILYDGFYRTGTDTRGRVTELELAKDRSVLATGLVGNDLNPGSMITAFIRVHEGAD
jgi:hypothetical protein